MDTLNALTEYGLYKIQLKPERRHRFILISSEASHIPHHAPHIAHHAPHTAHHAPHTAHHARSHTAHHAPSHTAHNTTHHNTHDTKKSHQTAQDGHHIVNKTHKNVHPDATHTTHNEKHTMQNSNIQHGNTTINNANSNIQHGNGSTYNKNNTKQHENHQHQDQVQEPSEILSKQHENHQHQDQVQEPSEILSNQYKLDPQPKWGGPQKQSANVPKGQWRLNSAVTFLTVGFIKTRKRFSGKESSTALFEMFCWCADNKDKAFFRRLFDYTDWKILNINKIGIYDMVETSIVSSVVVEKFAYAMNLLLETSKYTRLSTESIKRLEKMKASLSTLG